MTTLVIPDTNILYSDPFLEKPLVKTIIAAEERAGLKLVIPAVVIDELRNKVVERLEKATSDGNKVGREFANLSGRTEHEIKFYVNNMEQQAVLDRFEQRVKELAQEGRILDYPVTSPKQLAQRSIRRKLPFQGNDRGMRDTLIWLTVKEHLPKDNDESTNVIFVTNDERAFLEKNTNKLHDTLKKELESESIHLDSIIVHRDLNEVIGKFISGKLSNADYVEAAIKGSRINDFTDQDDTVTLLAQDWMYGHNDVFDEPYTITQHHYREFEGLEGARYEDVDETFDLGCGLVTVNTAWTGEANVTGVIVDYLEEGLHASVRFTVSSIVERNGDKLAVQSHEIIDVEVFEMEELVDVGDFL